MTAHAEAKSVTASEDRIPLHQKFAFGLGAFVNNLLADAMGRMLIVLNLGLGMNPALAGLLGALPRITDALTDPLMGFVSDNTRSRWGRRRPYIFIGAIAAGVSFALLWQLPAERSEQFYFWFFLAGSLVFYLAYTMFATPWVALGYELTPDYHERTRLMGTQNFIGQLAYVATPWVLVIMQDNSRYTDLREGAAGLAMMIGAVVIVVGVIPALLLRERTLHDASQEPAPGPSTSRSIKQLFAEFFAGFATTLKFRPFLKICAATFLVFNGFMLVASFQSYVIIYYVFAGDLAMGAKYAGYVGSIGAISTFAIIVLVTWLGTHIGKRRAFYLAIGISILGYISKWFLYDPEIPWLMFLSAPLTAFGLGSLFTLMPSMVADVVDMDEVHTRERREGMYGSIFWWVVKLGMAAAIAAGGLLLNVTGFDVNLGADQSAHTLTMMRIFDAFIPAVASVLAIWAIASFSISEQKAREVRQLLEARRGQAMAATVG